jgi:ligand-binding SRPBCC domain-containing protein
MIRHVYREQFVAGDPARIWEFFATPHNLDTITPPRMKFEIVGAVAPRMYPGQTIEYRIGILPGLSTRWLTEITHVREGEYFVDEQRVGPYSLWHHEHHFVPTAGGVNMTDHVTYAVGFGPIGWLVERCWIRGQLAEIFDFRRAKIAELFPGTAR